MYAEVSGFGLSSDAYHMTAPHPDGKGAIKVMKHCLDDAKLNSSEIDLINMHGTSTSLGDIAETKAVKEEKKESKTKIPARSNGSDIDPWRIVPVITLFQADAMINHHCHRIVTQNFFQHSGDANNNHIKLSVPQFSLSHRFISTIDEFNSNCCNRIT